MVRASNDRSEVQMYSRKYHFSKFCRTPGNALVVQWNFWQGFRYIYTMNSLSKQMWCFARVGTFLYNLKNVRNVAHLHGCFSRFLNCTNATNCVTHHKWLEYCNPGQNIFQKTSKSSKTWQEQKILMSGFL